MMNRTHIAIVNRLLVGALIAGRKRIESRLSQTRRAPLGCVRVGDRVLFKESGGPLVASARVARVREYRALSPARVAALHRAYGRLVCAPATYWRQRRRCRYAVLMWLDDVVRIDAAVNLPLVARQYGAAWIAMGRESGMAFAEPRP